MFDVERHLEVANTLRNEDKKLFLFHEFCNEQENTLFCIVLFKVEHHSYLVDRFYTSPLRVKRIKKTCMFFIRYLFRKMTLLT